jgi:hypothetical protein
MDGYGGHQYRNLCSFKNLTHVPCPGCGMGRATLLLFKGDLLASLRYHLLCIPFTVAIVSGVLWLIRDILFQQHTLAAFLKNPLHSAVRWGLVGSILGSWVVNMLRGI